MIDLRALVQRKQGFLFLPLIYRLAGRLEQMDWEELAGDPTSASYALRAAQRLFHLPAIGSHFRVGVEAEACGADLARDDNGEWHRVADPANPSALTDAVVQQPPLSHALEVTRRLPEELKGQAGVVAVLTGPRTLSGMFAGPVPGLGQFYATLARAYAEAGAQALLLVEDPRAATLTPNPASALAQLHNVARYFRLPTLLLDDSATGPVPGFDLTLGGTAARTLPVALLQQPPHDTDLWRREGAPLLLTDWEIPPELPAEHLLAWVDALE